MSNKTATASEVLTTLIDLDVNGIQNIYNGPCMLRGVFINTVMSAHSVAINDDTTLMYTLAADTKAGQWIEFGDTIFSTSLKLTANNSSTGKVRVCFIPITEGLVGGGAGLP